MSHTEVPEVELIVELMNGTFTYSSKRIPPRPNGSILKVSFLQGCDFFILTIEGFVLIMELVQLVIWCVYQEIKFNGKNMSVLCQPS
jgi:hypothetical protein